jgi:hypothetical protein
MSQIEKDRDSYLNNLKLQIKLQQVGLKSWGDDKAREANKVFQSPYSAKMIEDYNKNLETPYIDPISGNKYKYKLIDQPDLDSVEDKLILIGKPISTIDSEINKRRPLIEKEERRLFKLNQSSAEMRMYISENETNGEEDVAERVAEYKDKEIPKFESLIEVAQQNIQQGNDKLTDLMTELQQAKQTEEQNNEIRVETKKSNDNKLKTYRDTLSALNKGAFDVDQYANETDDEYLARIRRWSEILVINQGVYFCD